MPILEYEMDAAKEWRVAAFPLSISQSKKYFVDGAGRPFLVHGDAAWSLIAELKREEVDAYLDDRKARGFNTILVSLIEHKYATYAPANAYGEQPFLKPGDFSTPNDRYFSRADWVLRRAADKGFLVLLAPAFAGARGEDEGWYQEMSAADEDKLRQYGRFLGERYKDFSNIIWVEDGDYNPPRKELVRAVAEGIAETDSKSYQTAHCATETSAVALWSGEPWLRVDTIYTYGPVYTAALREYRLKPDMPFLLIETIYENEHDVSQVQLRAQAFQALFSGAAGQVFGNNPVWHFSGPGLVRSWGTWRSALASPGAKAMSHIRQLFEEIPWWQLEPDLENHLLLAGLGEGHERAVAARTADGSFGIIYLPTIRAITVNFKEFGERRVSAIWYDPTSGEYSEVQDLIPGRSLQKIVLRKRNSADGEDWVLILRGEEKNPKL